jgi:nitrogen PTS system EIIA component
MNITDFLDRDLVFSQLKSTRKSETINELAALMASRLPEVSAADLVRVLTERERLGSTAIGEGLAIPHGKLDTVGTLVAAFARSRKGVNYESEDGQPTYFFFVLLAPPSSTGDHLKALARISRIFKNAGVGERLLNAESTEEMYRILEEEDRG